jgi:hypothetical protein
MRHLILATLSIFASFGAPAFAADANPPEPSQAASQQHHHHHLVPKHTAEKSKETATTSAAQQGIKKTPDNKALAIIPP